MAEQEMLPVRTGFRFDEWPTDSLASQCRAQAREQLDPEYSAFMEAVANRLAATKAADERVRVMAEALLSVAKEVEANPHCLPTAVYGEVCGALLWHGDDRAALAEGGGRHG